MNSDSLHLTEFARVSISCNKNGTKSVQHHNQAEKILRYQEVCKYMSVFSPHNLVREQHCLVIKPDAFHKLDLIDLRTTQF
jgi:hypothetical protein